MQLLVTSGALALASLFALTGGVHAQDDFNEDETVSREVVQALPSAEVAALNDALRRLARNGKDLSALIDAGNAALRLGDDEAAIGFFGRAHDIAPANAQVKLGLAAVFMRSERPVEALRYFAEAERAGASPDSVAGDRGLAYDLVGDNRLAQQSYRRALARGQDDEIVRRLALSHAIAGDRQAFDETLRPLMMKRDLASYRARAFGLAILGDLNEARGLVTTVIPRDLASRIIPYLEFMPRLTKAQQAAAANLGIFPKAAEIGRDDPAIVAFRSRPQQEEPTAVTGPAAPPGPVLGQHWVQLAAGTNRGALINDWNRLQRRVPELLGSYQPHVVQVGAMHRLLAGPLSDEGAALELVTALARKRVDSLSVKSNPDAKVEKLQ